MRRLAHMRDIEGGARIWAGARTITPGPSRSILLLAMPEETLPSEITRRQQLGSQGSPAHYTIAPEYPTKHPVMSSYFLSDPTVFQSYFKVHWEDMFGMSANLEEGARSLHQLPNRNARGRAEGQALQQYNPWPSASDLYAPYPAAELKAL
jgi:hypothetical protein